MIATFVGPLIYPMHAVVTVTFSPLLNAVGWIVSLALSVAVLAMPRSRL